MSSSSPSFAYKLLGKSPLFVGDSEAEVLSSIARLFGREQFAALSLLIEKEPPPFFRSKNASTPQPLPEAPSACTGLKGLAAEIGAVALDPRALELAEALLRLDPLARPSAKEALDFEYFKI